MKLVKILILFSILGILLLPQASKAGCCKAGSLCYSDQALGYPDLVPSEQCMILAGTYDTGCTCPDNSGANGTGSGAVDETKTACCKYAPQNCISVAPGAMCNPIPGLANGQYDSNPCSQITYCTGLGSTTKPTITQPSNNVIFKPQITLPGSKFIAGESIVITGNTLGEYIAAFYTFFVTAIAILAAIMVLYGGFKWLVAAGNRGQVQNAKEQISSALIGLLIAFTAYLLLLSISPKLVKFTSLSLTSIKPIQQTFAGAEIAYGFKGTPPSTASLTKTWAIQMKSLYDAQISSVANSNVPRDLIYAIIYTESGGRADALSGAGACGIMQLLPATAGKTCGELLDPQVGIQAGVNYLQTLASKTCPAQATKKSGEVIQCVTSRTSCRNGDQYYMTAAYNGGVGANCDSHESSCVGRTWWECEVNTGYQETRNYVLKVQQAREKLKCFLNELDYPC
jgi:hypothetical protein